MTALCLCNNISRHIKITFMVLNFVTEICSNFLKLKNNVLGFEFRTRVENNVLYFEFCTRVENNVLY